MEAQKLKELKKFSAQLRIDQLQMFRQRGMGHIGGCLSVTELISVLYGKQMKFDPKDPGLEGPRLFGYEQGPCCTGRGGGPCRKGLF